MKREGTLGNAALFRSCAWGLAMVAAVAGVGGWLYFGFFRQPPPPDVAEVANSAVAREADQEIADLMDDQFSQLRGALPWATFMGTSVADVCQTDDKVNSFAVGAVPWKPITCRRTAALYEAFDGDYRQRLAQLDGVLQAAGWRRGPGRGGLVGELASVERPLATAGPARSPQAAARPERVSLGYGVSTGHPSIDTESRSLSGFVEVTVAPDTLLKSGAIPDGLGTPPADDASTRSAVVAWHSLSPTGLAAAAPPDLRGMLSVHISSTYFTDPAPSPDPAQNYGGVVCRSTGGRCG